MTAQEIPSDDQIARAVKKDWWSEVNTAEGTKVEISSDAFKPRRDHPPGTGPEENVSVDWIEFFPGDLSEQLKQVCDAVSVRGRKVGGMAQFAVVVVQNVFAAGTKGGKQLVVKTLGETNDPSHSGIFGLAPDDEIISQEIARLAHSYPAFPEKLKQLR